MELLVRDCSDQCLVRAALALDIQPWWSDPADQRTEVLILAEVPHTLHRMILPL
jgi:hypothetical protein